MESTSIPNQEQTPEDKLHWGPTIIRPNKRYQGYPTKEAGHQNPETQQINSDSQPQTKIDNKMKNVGIMQHEIETATSSHIQIEIICLKAMFSENQEEKAYPLMTFKATLDPETMYMHQAMKEEDK